MRKLFLFLMAVLTCSVSVMAQNRTITGTVLDATNDEPLIGATIIPNGGGHGTQADIDGNFTISVPANVKNAVVSCVGYSPRTVELQDGMVVHLNASASELDGVIVVAYGNANKESLTGSVAVVGAKDIEDRPVTSATSVLEGNAPGVQVNSTVGQPGSDPSIRIRGFGSVNSSNAPITVVDGIVFNGSIADLNPADIESISVLKDAASAALYGNKAANGVILITTKRAKQAGKVEVTLSVRQGMYNRGLPEYNRLAADQWMEAQLVGAANYGVSSGLFPTFEQSLEDARINFIDVYAKNNIYNLPNDQIFDENGKLVAQIKPGYTDLDWWDAVSRQGYRQEYNINAAAAAEKYSIFASVGYLKEQGYLLRTDFERFNGRVNATFNPTSYFKFGLNLNATAQNSEVGQFDSVDAAINPFLTMFTAPIYPYYAHEADEYGTIRTDEFGNPMWNLTAQYLSNRNVAYELRKNFTNYRYDSIDATLFGTAILPYGFELTVRGNLSRYNQTANEYSNKEIGDAAPKGSITQEFSFANSHVFMQQLTWSQDYGLHHVDVLLGHENSDYYSDNSYIVNNTQTFDDNYTLSNFTVNMAAQGGEVEDKTESYLTRARYNFNQKYFAEASFRRDGSSRFHPDSRWGNFWSVGGSWIISRENFMQHPNLSWINYLKLRAAYGTVGNNAGASAYAYWDLYAMGTKYTEQTILYRAQIADPSIKWETTKSFDIGLEGTLFNDRLNFAVCYFDKRSTDLLFAVPLPLSAGSSIWGGLNESVTRNIGSVSNRGWELSFSGDIIRNRDFYWSASIDATFLKNKIVSLPGGRDIESGLQCLAEGRSIYEYYTYQYVGVDQMTGRALYYMDQDNQSVIDKAAENEELVTINGVNYTTNVSNAQKVWSGSAIPTVYGSFGTNLSWKGINLGLLFTYSLGGKTYDSNYASLMATSALGLGALHEDILKSWNGVPEGMTEESPNRIDPNGIPAIDYYNSTYDNASSSRWLTNSSYLVFKNLNISYDLPAKWIKALKMQGLNLGVSIDNLFTVTHRTGMNPQQSYSGGQSAYFVTPRVFSFQLTAKF